MFGSSDNEAIRAVRKQATAVFEDFHRTRVLLEDPPLTDICNPLYSDEWHSNMEQRIGNIETFIEGMRKLLLVGGLGIVGLAVRKLLRRSPDFTDVDCDQPQRSVESMERAADVPGGVRP